MEEEKSTDEDDIINEKTTSCVECRSNPEVRAYYFWAASRGCVVIAAILIIVVITEILKIRSERLKDDRYMGLKWSSATSTVISICNVLNAIIAPLIGTIVDGTK